MNECFGGDNSNSLAYDLACLTGNLFVKRELLEDFKLFRVCTVRVINP